MIREWIRDHEDGLYICGMVIWAFGVGMLTALLLINPSVNRISSYLRQCSDDRSRLQRHIDSDNQQMDELFNHPFTCIPGQMVAYKGEIFFRCYEDDRTWHAVAR